MLHPQIKGGGGRAARGALRFAGAALMGSLVVLAFPLYGSEAGLDALIWVALVPLILAARGVGWRGGLLLGWTAGLVIEAGGFIWILHAVKEFTRMPWPIASGCFLGWLLYSSFAWGLLGAALGLCRTPASVLWVLPFWAGVEHLFPRLFPWHLGGALYAREWLVQSADLFGASGLTALVFLGNVAIYAIIQLVIERIRGGARFPAITAAALLAALAGSLIYGALRLDSVREAEGAARPFRVLCLQGCRDPLERGEESLRLYLDLSRKALAADGADLVVWPEGADPCPFDLTRGGDPWAYHKVAGGSPGDLHATPLPVPLITGGTGYDVRRSPAPSNIVAYVAPGSPPRFYEKNIRMPFGEVVPGLDLLPPSIVESLGIRVRTIARGEGNPIFPFQGATFRNLICYEAIFPGYSRRCAEGVDFLVNVTEDMWYGWTAQIPQQMSVLILRAIENRTPLVRATNVGPTGIIGATGAFQRGETIFAPEVVRAELRPVRMPTVYGHGGCHLPAAMLIVSLAGPWLLGIRARARKRRPSSQ